MAQIANETPTTPAAPHEKPIRIVTVPDRFLNRFWAVLTSVVFHPFSDTIIRLTRPDDRTE